MKKLLIVLAVLLLAAPTMAAEWNFYGSARFGTWSADVDMDRTDVPGYDSDRDTIWDQQSNSRIGATVKLNDEIGGGFEMSDSFGKRKLYGTYNFGVGEVLIGQDYTPTTPQFYSRSAYEDDGQLLGIGQFYISRVPMIQFNFRNLSFGNLKLAFVKPYTDDYEIAGSGGFKINQQTGVIEGTPLDPARGFDTDTTIPKIELSYGYKGEMFFVDLFGGYQTYEIEIERGPSEDIDAYVVGIGAGVNVGPAYFNAGFHMGQNFGNYGNANVGAKYFGDDDYFLDKARYEGGRLIDSDGMGYLAVLGVKANDRLTFEAGYGYEETEGDDDYEAEASQYYLNATINITKGFFVVPEIGMIEYEDEGKRGHGGQEPEVFYAGAKWQINF